MVNYIIFFNKNINENSSKDKLNPPYCLKVESTKSLNILRIYEYFILKNRTNVKS